MIVQIRDSGLTKPHSLRKFFLRDFLVLFQKQLLHCFSRVESFGQFAVAGIQIKDLKDRIFDALIHLLHQRVNLFPAGGFLDGIRHEMYFTIDTDLYFPFGSI